MANNKREKLFDQFPPVSTERWEEVIKADLKGADYDKKLVWRTQEGFSVRPYYRAEDLEGIGYMGSGCGEFPYVRGNKCGNAWKVHQTIHVSDVKEANATALKAIGAGAESIGFRLSEPLDKKYLSELMSGIDLNETEIVFDGELSFELPVQVLAVADEMGADPEKARIIFPMDPVIWQLSCLGQYPCGDGNGCFSGIANIIDSFKKYKKCRFGGIHGECFHNSGSTIVQELAFTLAAGHEHVVRLMQHGVSATDAARSIRFSMAVSSNYFMEMAKFRAGRMLWANIMEQYKPECACAGKMFAHAETSSWNMTAYDPYVNMLRGTTEAMSASLAGVHSLEVLPFDTPFEEPTEFSARIARNVQLLLKHESHFDGVVDPAGGSYYIENLTNSIADEAWKLFREVEEKGGYEAAFRSGFIVDAVKSSADAKDKAVATRRTVLLGTNQYPNFTEVADKAVTLESVSRRDGGNVLVPYRGAMAFEQMRLHVDRSGREPKAFMLTCGTLAMARARSQFACNFFACAGIRVEDNTFFKSVEEGARAALKSGAEIVVICAADDDYAELAPKAKEILGDKAIFVVAGAPASQPELEAMGIKNFISMKSNVLDTLKYYLKELGL